MTVPEGINQGRDPVTSLLVSICYIVACWTLTGWRDEWEERTKFGKAALILISPVRVSVGLAMVVLGFASSVLLLIELGITEVPKGAYSAYREFAFTGERQTGTDIPDKIRDGSTITKFSPEDESGE